MWMASGGQLSSFTGQLHLKQDSDFHLNRIPNHAWSHWLDQVFGTYTLDGLGLQTMWKPRSVPSDIHWKENTGLLALSCWVVSAGIELHRMLPIFPQSWEGRKWAETEEATMPERPFSFVLSVSSSSIISSSSYSFLFLSTFIYLFSFTFYFLLSLPFLFPCSDCSITTCPRYSYRQCIAMLHVLLFPQNNAFCYVCGLLRICSQAHHMFWKY